VTIDIDPTLSPFLTGNYSPVADELDIADLRVTGTIPEALRGVYMRNGANPAFAPTGKYHIFDGDGMIHAIEIADGKASYRNRFVESRGLRYEREQGHAVFGGLSNWVMPSPEVIAAAGMMKNTANTNVIRHGGKYLALMEGALPTELNRDLSTVGEYDYDGALATAMAPSMTAHPKWDPETGELLFFGYSPFPPYLRYHVADRSGTLTKTLDIDLPKAVMMHDFVATERHVVFFDLPAVFDANAMLTGDAFIRWEPSAGARIGVLPRAATSGDEIRWFELDPFFVFHFMNGWDADDRTVVVTGCRSAAMPTSFGDDEAPVGVHPHLHRWSIDLVNGQITETELDDRPADFPRINMSRSGHENRYGYLAHAAGWEDDTVEFNGVLKFDFTTGTSVRHEYGPTTEGGEAVFAPDPNGTAEDDGWLLNFVFDRVTQTSEFRIVDARTLDAEPVARIHLPRRVPFGFHGNWMPEDGALPSH